MLKRFMRQHEDGEIVINERRSITREKQREMDKLRAEIKQALEDKRATEIMFQFAVGHDEVEWAILRQMAAEQRYRMLLNKAREMDVEWSKLRGFVL